MKDQFEYLINISKKFEKTERKRNKLFVQENNEENPD